MASRGRSVTKRVTMADAPAAGAATGSATAARAARAASRGRSRAAAMEAVARDRAAAGAATGGTGTSAAPVVDPTALYMYWTVDVPRADQVVMMSSITDDWRAAEITVLTRRDLELLILGSGGFCGTNVSSSYLARRIPANPMLFVMSSKSIFERKRGDTTMPDCLGFILAKETDDKAGIYLDIICTAPRMGKYLLDYFHKYVFEQRKEYGYVKLSSLANVLTYYPRFGYQFRNTCAGAPLTDLSPALKSRDYKRFPVPVDTYAAYNDKDYMNFMYDTLYPLQLGVRTKENCKNPAVKLTREEYVDEKHDCAQDGYSMMLCAPRRAAAGAATGKAGGSRRRKTRRVRHR